jgi:site-specific recombinase XerD
VIGALVEDFASWLHTRNYTPGSIITNVRALAPLVRWWRRRRVDELHQVTADELANAHEYFFRRQPVVGQAVRLLRFFLLERQIVPASKPQQLSASEMEWGRFAAHLRQVRGLSENTAIGHLGRLRRFLTFLRFDQRPQAIAKLRREEIENFLRHMDLTNNRHSIQHVVATLRSFLRWQYVQGVLSRPLHLQIDTPRVYQLEHLPQAMPWDQVRTLLRSIDRSKPDGLRDFTMLYLVAAYGLRVCEVVRLRLEDIDWRNATLRVGQTKTRQVLQLPLMDQAGDILQRYLRQGRPQTERRELFLRLRAPLGPLNPASVHAIKRWIRRRDLKIKPVGNHSLRHAFAVHLLRQGVSTKAIGDAMGHGDVRSTAIYLRLAIDDLRAVGLPVPEAMAIPVCLKSPKHYSIPIIRPASVRQSPLARFRSGFGASMQRYISIKQAMGRHYANEKTVLLKWDAWLYRFQGRNDAVASESFQRWIETLTHLTPTVRRARMHVVRNFLLFHTRDHRVGFIPDVADFPKKSPAKPPRLVSEAEMARVLATATQLTPVIDNPVRAQTMRIAFILSFCCGLRRGELLRLRLGHFDTKQKLLRIEGTKFHKSRLVPLHESVTDELKDYLEQWRRKRLPLELNSFLIGTGRHPEMLC